MKKQLILFILLIVTSFTFSKNVVNTYKDLMSGKKEEAFKSFLDINKKDSSSVIVNYAFALLYSDASFSQSNLELSYKYSKQSINFIDCFTSQDYTKKNYTWNQQVTKSELRDIKKIKLEPLKVLFLKDSILTAIFEIVKKEDKIDSFNKFIANYPESKSIKYAMERIHWIAFNYANNVQSIKEFEKYIKDYPESSYVNKAQKAIYLLAFEEANKTNTIDAFNKYIIKYPNSDKVIEAKEKIPVIAFNEANNKNSIGAYNDFINLYPNSKFIDEAKHKIYILNYIDPIYTNSDIIIFKENGLKGIELMAGFLTDKFETLSEIQKDSVYVTFSDTYIKIIYESNKESSFDYSRLKNINNPNIDDELQDELIKNLNTEISNYGVTIDRNHNNLFCGEPNYLYRLFKGRISSAMDLYLERGKWLAEKDINSGMHIYFSIDDAYESYRFWEDFITKYPNFIFISKAKESYSSWLDRFLHGFPYDRNYDSETHLLFAHKKSFFEKIIKKNEPKKSTIEVAKYYNDLKKNNFKDPEWNPQNEISDNFQGENVEKKASYILKSFTKYIAYAENDANIYEIEISHAEMDKANSQGKIILLGKMYHYIKYKSSNNTPMGQIISMATGNAQIVASEKVTFYCDKSELAKDWSTLNCEGFFSYTSIKVNIDWSSLTMHTRLIVSGKDYALKLI